MTGTQDTQSSWWQKHMLCLYQGPALWLSHSAWHLAISNIFHFSVTSSSLHSSLSMPLLPFPDISKLGHCTEVRANDLSVCLNLNLLFHMQMAACMCLFRLLSEECVGKNCSPLLDRWGGDKSAQWPSVNMHENPFTLWELRSSLETFPYYDKKKSNLPHPSPQSQLILENRYPSWKKFTC